MTEYNKDLLLKGSTVVVPSDDIYSDLTVIQNPVDMTVSYTTKVATRYPALLPSETPLWAVKEMGYNVSGVLLYVKTLSLSDVMPDFVPSGVAD